MAYQATDSRYDTRPYTDIELRSPLSTAAPLGRNGQSDTQTINDLTAQVSALKRELADSKLEADQSANASKKELNKMFWTSMGGLSSLGLFSLATFAIGSVAFYNKGLRTNCRTSQIKRDFDTTVSSDIHWSDDLGSFSLETEQGLIKVEIPRNLHQADGTSDARNLTITIPTDPAWSSIPTSFNISYGEPGETPKVFTVNIDIDRQDTQASRNVE
jgi:hypothetical protein